MKNTHEEWLVQVKQKWEPDKWRNAIGWWDGSKGLGHRYVKTESEAREVLANAYQLWNSEQIYDMNDERITTETVGMIGISMVHTKKSDEDLMIIEHRIRKRIVTDWETV